METPTENLPVPQAEPVLPKIKDHQLTPFEFKVFQLCMEGKSPTHVCLTMDIDSFELRNIRKQEWFKDLQESYLEQSNQAFHLRMVAEQDTVLDAFFQVMKGGHEKSANAIINGVKLFTQLGKNSLYDFGRGGTEININSKNNIHTDLHINLDFDKIAKASSEQLLEIYNSGEVPEEFRKKD